MNKTAKIKLNWPLLGNDHILEYFSRNLASGKVAQSYIFAGPDDLGKATIANYFAFSLLCKSTGMAFSPCGKCESCRRHGTMSNKTDQGDLSSVHTDYYVVKRETDKKNVSIEQVRQLIHVLNLSSFSNGYKVGILRHADSLSEEAANALLKTLEEPKPKTVLILVSTDLDRLPATVISRSQVLHFRPVQNEVIYKHLIEQYQLPRTEAKNIARLSLGRPALAIKFAMDKKFNTTYSKRTELLLSFWQSDLITRWQLLDELLPAKLAGQEAVKSARRILETWSGLMRDMLLLHLGQPDLVQHQSVLSSLERLKSRISATQVAGFFEIIGQAEKYLRANVSPRLVLENVAAYN